MARHVGDSCICFLVAIDLVAIVYDGVCYSVVDLNSFGSAI